MRNKMNIYNTKNQYKIINNLTCHGFRKNEKIKIITNIYKERSNGRNTCYAAINEMGDVYWIRMEEVILI